MIPSSDLTMQIDYTHLYAVGCIVLGEEHQCIWANAPVTKETKIKCTSKAIHESHMSMKFMLESFQGHNLNRKYSLNS